MTDTPDSLKTYAFVPYIASEQISYLHLSQRNAYIIAYNIHNVMFMTSGKQKRTSVFKLLFYARIYLSLTSREHYWPGHIVHAGNSSPL